MIRDRVVFGTSSAKGRSKLIDEGDKLTLAKAIQMGQNHEYSQTQLKTMSSPVPTQDVHALNQGKQGTSSTFHGQRRQGRRQQQTAPAKKKDKCTRCSYDTHPEGKIYPAMGKTCSLSSRKKKKKKKKHFAQCCRYKSMLFQRGYLVSYSTVLPTNPERH